MRYSLRAQFFFSKFITRVKKASDKGLYRVCGLIRTASRRSLRRRSQPSPPGMPPSAHTAGGLRLIEYVVRGQTGFIGPIKFPASNRLDSPVPHVHEFGGTYISLTGYANYPRRSFMLYTLNNLKRRGIIPRQFSIFIMRLR